MTMRAYADAVMIGMVGGAAADFSKALDHLGPLARLHPVRDQLEDKDAVAQAVIQPIDSDAHIDGVHRKRY